MTVIQSVMGSVKPGRYEDFIALAHEAEKLTERHGARDIRLMSAGLAGESTGKWSMNMEFADLEAFGVFSDEFQADSDALSMMSRTRAPESPSVIEGITLASEIPTGRTPAPGRGNAVEVYVSRCNPGQLERAIALGVTALDIVEANGAMNGRLCTIDYAGLGSGLLMATWEWANMTAMGRGLAVFNRDAAAKDLAASLYAADAPTTPVWSGLYNVIPL